MPPNSDDFQDANNLHKSLRVTTKMQLFFLWCHTENYQPWAQFFQKLSWWSRRNETWPWTYIWVIGGKSSKWSGSVVIMVEYLSDFRWKIKIIRQSINNHPQICKSDSNKEQPNNSLRSCLLIILRERLTLDVPFKLVSSLAQKSVVTQTFFD